MDFAGSPYKDPFKALVHQLLMSTPSSNSNLDLQRLQEELLRSRRDLPVQETRADRGSYGIVEGNRVSREREEVRDRSYQDDIGKSERRGHDRSNFFGGALERNDGGFMQSGSGRWSSGLADLDDRRPDRIDEGIIGWRYDERGVGNGSNTLFFNQGMDPATNLRSTNLPFPSSYSTDPLMNNSLSHQWTTMNDQGSATYGMNNTYQPPFTIEPPPPSQPKPNCSEKPLGCHTIFIGGLPDEITDDIIREFMNPCGAIESIRITKGKGDKKFCHLRFLDAESVELAIGYSGYKLFVNNGDQRYGGRIHVDYAKSREDDIQYERHLKAKEREAKKEEMEKPLVLFTESAATELMQSMRSSSGFQESFQTLAQWLERGECTRKTSATFFNLLGAVNGHIKRIVKEKKEYEEIVERQKQEQAERAKAITAQGAAILKVFKAASKKKSWDHFSKAQRRNISEWNHQVEKEIKISEEEQMGNRIEVGMDLDNESDHTQTASEPSQTTDEDTGEPKPKHMKTEAANETTQATLDAQNIKFQAQNASLKALAEKNTSLIWEVEGYKKEIVVLKQRFAGVFQDKDLQIARLMTAVQGLQNFFQHVTLNVSQTSNVNVEVISEVNQTNDTPEQQTEDAEVNSQESSLQSCTQNKPNEEMENENKEEKEKELNEQNITEEKEATEEGVAISEDLMESINQGENSTEECTHNEESAQSASQVVRLTSKDMSLVGLLCSYLQICPYGATSEQVLTHIQRHVPGVPSDELERVLDSLPMLFIGDGLEFCNKTWKFKHLK